jgi:hypothetical protein
LIGKTYLTGIGGLKVGTVLAFRFQRWNGPDVVFSVTYERKQHRIR